MPRSIRAFTIFSAHRANCYTGESILFCYTDELEIDVIFEIVRNKKVRHWDISHDNDFLVKVKGVTTTLISTLYRKKT